MFCAYEMTRRPVLQADQPSVPLLCDSVATSVGVVVSVINILMESHAEKIHGTRGIISMQDFLCALPASRLEEVFPKYSPQYWPEVHQILDAARRSTEMRGLMPHSMLSFVADEQPSGHTEEQQLDDAAGPSAVPPEHSLQQV